MKSSLLTALIFAQVAMTAAVLPPNFRFEKSCRDVEDGCRCLFRMKEIRCCCFGHIEELNDSVTILYLYKPVMKTIEKSTFRNYTQLQEIVLDSADRLTRIDARTFEYLPNLRKLSITNAPMLTAINGTLIHKNYKLLSLTISNTHLKIIPKVKMSTYHLLPVETIDFSRNQLQYVGEHHFAGISAKHLILSSNEISFVDDEAFAQSKFVSILLNANHELRKLSPLAFAKIELLHKLDLSDTSITELPVIGLKEIKHIVLKNVPTLKRLPPVLAFTELTKAEFTYPYHCCFFKYANREYAKGQGTQYSSHYKEIQRRSCTRQDTHRIRKRETSQSTANPLMDALAALLDSLDASAFSEAADVTDAKNTTEYDDYDSHDFIEPFPPGEVGDHYVREKCISTAIERFYLNITCSPEPDGLNPCEDIVGYGWLRYMIWIIWVMAIIGNILVWVVIATVWTRRSRLHYFFMVNLSIADFLTGLYLGILAIQDARTADEYYNYAVEWQTGWGCAVAGFLSVFASELSAASMLMIAFEIYYNARFAFYGKRISTRNAYSLMAVGYGYALTMAVLPLVGISSYQRASICLPLRIVNPVDRVYLLFGQCVTVLCFAGMVLNYVLINCMIRNPQMPARKMDTQILRRSLVLIVTNMVCWVPVLFFGITATLGLPLITLTNAKICLILFYPINSCANPYLYVFLTQIGSEAKKRAVLNIKRHSGDKSSISRFYYSQSPAEREHLREVEEENQRNIFLQITQTTSLGSTPRNSSASDGKRGSTGSDDSRKNSHVSFQEQVLINASDHFQKRKSVIGRGPRVSAAPEMSVISEHSTNSGEDASERGPSHLRDPQHSHSLLDHLRSVLHLHPRRTSLAIMDSLVLSEASPVRENSQSSLGQDSGRGDSIHSKRFSTSSADSEGVPRFLVHSSVLQRAHHDRPHFGLYPRRYSEQRDTPALVLSEYVSLDMAEDEF